MRLSVKCDGLNTFFSKSTLKWYLLKIYKATLTKTTRKKMAKLQQIKYIKKVVEIGSRTARDSQSVRIEENKYNFLQMSKPSWRNSWPQHDSETGHSTAQLFWRKRHELCLKTVEFFENLHVYNHQRSLPQFYQTQDYLSFIRADT